MDAGLAQRSHDGIKMICSRTTWLTDGKMFTVSGRGLAVSGMDHTGSPVHCTTHLFLSPCLSHRDLSGVELD